MLFMKIRITVLTLKPVGCLNLFLNVHNLFEIMCTKLITSFKIHNMTDRGFILVHYWPPRVLQTCAYGRLGCA